MMLSSLPPKYAYVNTGFVSHLLALAKANGMPMLWLAAKYEDAPGR